ncbi:MAG TPA: SRPBCC domain-containing protein [Candidatus Binatia bacterium]|jgi:hypothetical protein|nr:SRPBCC domain-containing protein [Candidatus Binatia bacterium]
MAPDKENDPEQFQTTVTFEERDGKTKLTMRALFPSVEDCEKTKKFGAVEAETSF